MQAISIAPIRPSKTWSTTTVGTPSALLPLNKIATPTISFACIDPIMCKRFWTPTLPSKTKKPFVVLRMESAHSILDLSHHIVSTKTSKLLKNGFEPGSCAKSRLSRCHSSRIYNANTKVSFSGVSTSECVKVGSSRMSPVHGWRISRGMYSVKATALFIFAKTWARRNESSTSRQAATSSFHLTVVCWW